LSIVLIGLGIRQKKNAEVSARRAAEEAARKHEQEERDRQQATERDAMQRQLENERAEASAREAEASAREAELAQEISAREQQLAAMAADKEVFRLVTTEGVPAIELRIPLDAVWTVGGGQDNAVVLDHDSISGQHAQLSVDNEGRLWVSDLASSNGTFVASAQTRGQAIRLESEQVTELCDGDQLWLSKSYCLAIEALK
jgi:pSer/pThr/pTyr-binding forkhead associated (FHA) protein